MKGEVLALLAALLWGIAPIFDKIVASSGVSPYLANVVRTIGALVFLLASAIILGQLEFSSLGYRNAVLLLTAGLMGGGIAMVLYYLALRFAEASRVVPLTSIYPLFTVVFSAILLGERVSYKVAVGTVLIVLGVVLVCS